MTVDKNGHYQLRRYMLREDGWYIIPFILKFKHYNDYVSTRNKFLNLTEYHDIGLGISSQL